jgi:hypothetical protein
LNKPVANDDIEKDFVVKIKELRKALEEGEDNIMQLKNSKNNIKIEFTNVDI